MEEFEIRIQYKGRDEVYKGSLLVIGYTHKIEVVIGSNTVIFEPDEERNYRAIVSDEQLYNDVSFEKELLIKIAGFLQKFLS